jgi:cytoskeletal protein RodZ
MATIGQELKRERELRGIPLQEIADATKINIRFLRALEEDQLDMLPEKFFTRGIIRTYAKYLGLDEENVLNLYLESLQLREPREEEVNKNEPSYSLPKEKKRFWLFFCISLIILAFFITITFILKRKDTLPPESKIPSAAQTSQKETKQELQLESPVNPSDIQEDSEKSQDGLALEIRVEQDTWMEIYADQELQYSGIKPRGTTLQFKALQEFIIHLGNAGGITYTINGRKGKKLGEPGAVTKDIKITMDNYQDFVEEENNRLNQEMKQLLSKYC